MRKRKPIPFVLEERLAESIGPRRLDRFWVGYGYSIHEIRGTHRETGIPRVRFHVRYTRPLPAALYELERELEGPGLGGSWPTMTGAKRAANRHRFYRLEPEARQRRELELAGVV